MEFEDQEIEEEEHEEEDEEDDEEDIGLPLNSTNYGPNMPSPVGALDAPPLRRPRYRECLKNHAVGLGCHAVDGCCEFLPGGPEGTLDALKCAACNCHRNFHRKETDTSAAVLGGVTGGGFNFSPHPHQGHHYLPPPPPHHHHQQQQFSPYYRTPSGYLHLAAAAHHQRPLALPSTSGGGGGGSQSREDEDMTMTTSSGGGGGGSKKRFRTKFTAEQKEKMMGLAERLEWRIQKQDEEVVQHFCNETGVKRHVLKVWMHNNKHTLGTKKQQEQP